MGDVTKIQWADHTFNPWIGCSKVHAGCTHCYAEADMATRRGRVVWGANGTRSVTSEANWKKPLKWNAEAKAAGVRKRVFCASLADVFEDWQGPIVDHKGMPLHHADKWYGGNRGQYLPIEGMWIGKSLVKMSDLRSRLFALIDATPNLDWLLLTKRPENIGRMWPTEAVFPSVRGTTSPFASTGRYETDTVSRKPRKFPNVWLGTSVSDQETADKMIPELLTCRELAPVLFVSAEPLLWSMDLIPYMGGRSYSCKCGFHRTESELIFSGGESYRCVTCGQRCAIGGTIDWLIVGGESGHNARPCRVDWVRSLVKQCKEAGVAPFVKQLGRFPVSQLTSSEQWPGGCGLPSDGPLRFDPDGFGNYTVRGIRDPKGGDPSEWPEDLRVREFPTESEGVPWPQSAH